MGIQYLQWPWSLCENTHLDFIEIYEFQSDLENHLKDGFLNA